MDSIDTALKICCFVWQQW